MSPLKDRMRSQLQTWLRLAGKGEKKVAAVFGTSAEASHQAVTHLRRGAPGVPVWLFTTADPLPETEALCERVFQSRGGFSLAAKAQSELWKCWVAISAVTWTGDRGHWGMKLAPFLIPPFRVLVLNKTGGFFDGSVRNICTHGARESGDRWQSAKGSLLGALHDTKTRGRDLLRGVRKVSAAAGLAALSMLLRWTSQPHIRLFQRLRGRFPLTLSTEAAEGTDVARFVQTGTEWDGEALEKFAETSDARWILWQNGAEDSLHDAGPLFENDARTFAASRQVSFRGWKPSWLVTAPFRALQPGEASRVLAPLSGAILVERKKLLALGIPRASMAATGWLILFWKAAAAGWRSYSIGQNAALREQADFPIQETAFVLRALSEPALRCLSPRQEELSRGNIGFAPGLMRMANKDSGRMKVLIVSPFLPYPLSHGGAVRMFNLCRELSDRVDFTLVAMREANDQVDYATLHEVFREVHVVDKDERTANDNMLPAQVSSSESKSLRAVITQLAQKVLPDLLQIEYTHFAGFRDSAPGVPALLVEHDLTFSLYRQLADAKPSAAAYREYEKWLAFERKWLGAYEGVWTVSEEDRSRAMFEGRRGADTTFEIANGVDIDRYRPSDVAEAPEIFYVGSFRHLPNMIGFDKLRHEIMPRVWEKHPEARLRVVAGPEHERYWRQFGRTEDLRKIDPRIEIQGFVEDLRPLYARASVVAVPLEVSAGTNIKVLEAMACGKAIVTTPVGCAGLGLQDEYHLAIRTEWGAFADALADVLSCPDLRHGLGSRARQAVEANFSWSAIADRAYGSYLVVAGETTGSNVRRRSLSVA